MEKKILVYYKDVEKEEFDLKQCCLCGCCIAVCEKGALEFQRDEDQTWCNKLIWNPKKCNRCGECANGCTTGVLKIEDRELKVIQKIRR